MMLGQVIRVETRAIIGLRNLEAVFIIVSKRSAVAVEMIEDAEFHLLPTRVSNRLDIFII